MLKGNTTPISSSQRVLSMLLLSLFDLVGVSQVYPADVPANQVMERLLDTWEPQNVLVESARVNFYQLILTRHEINAISRKELIDLVECLGDFANSENRKEFAESVCSESRLATGKTWMVQHAVKRGSEHFISGGGRFRSITSDYDIGVSLKQVDIFLPGVRKLHFSSVEDLRTLIPRKLLELTNSKSTQDGRSVLAYRSGALKTGFEAILDDSTGFVHIYRELDFSGAVSAEHLQFQPTLFGDGITYPLARLYCKYDNETITWLEATFLKDASFNIPVADEEFHVPVEVGQTLVDRRGSKAITTTVDQHFDNALVAADVYAAQRTR